MIAFNESPAEATLPGASVNERSPGSTPPSSQSPKRTDRPDSRGSLPLPEDSAGPPTGPKSLLTLTSVDLYDEVRRRLALRGRPWQ
jgi:hypothetical protein